MRPLESVFSRHQVVTVLSPLLHADFGAGTSMSFSSMTRQAQHRACFATQQLQARRAPVSAFVRTDNASALRTKSHRHLQFWHKEFGRPRQS